MLKANYIIDESLTGIRLDKAVRCRFVKANCAKAFGRRKYSG